MAIPESELLRLILQEYSVGDLVHYEVLPHGYVNTSYAVTLSDGGSTRRYLLRRYKPDTEEPAIIFEHSIIRHLNQRGFALTAGVIATISGRTYVSHAAGANAEPDAGDAVFYALFEYLAGEDKHSWIRPDCSDGELAAAGEALARFHDAVSGLIPTGRSEPPMVDLLPLIATSIEDRLSRRGGSRFVAELAENNSLIQHGIRRVHRALDVPEFRQTLHLVNHGDYHPGNLKFDRGRVVGMFDFDWSKIDSRIFDLGVALAYFCASWDASHMDTYFRIEKAAAFLKGYQMALLSGGGISPLDAVEIKHLPDMIAAGNIYVMEWALRDYFGRVVDPDEYLIYLQHHLCLMRWFEVPTYRRKLSQMISETLLPLRVTHDEKGSAGI